MKPLYTISFFLDRSDISTKERYLKTLEEVRKWVEGKYKKWNRKIDFKTDGNNCAVFDRHSLVVRENESKDCGLISLNWQHPDEDDKNLSWKVDLKIARDEKDVWFSLQLSILMDVVSPPKFEFGAPTIIKTLISRFHCRIGEEILVPSYSVAYAGSMENFVEEFLLNTKRHLPIILISKNSEGNSEVDPDLLVKKCAGMAQVFVLDDKWASWKLSEIIGVRLACYNGAVRIYWPKMSLTDSCFKHNLYVKDFISKINVVERKFENFIAQRLARLSLIVDHFSFGRKIEAMIDKEKLAKIQVEHEQGKMKTEEFFALLEEIGGKLDSEKKLADDLQNKLNESDFKLLESEEENFRLKDQLEAMKKSYSQIKSYTENEEAVYVEENEREIGFKNVEEAAKKAEKDFNKTLVFHEKALVSASKSVYKSPERVYQLFEALNEIGCKWQKGEDLGNTWKEFLHNKGFSYKPDISMSTKGRYSEEYERVFKGQKVSIYEHVTIGKTNPEVCLSVHFWRDIVNKKIVIGHCGKHLPNMNA